MKKALSLALVGEGALSRSGIGKLPGLSEYLGAVKAGSIRIASRWVRQLRAGQAVCDYSELDFCRVFLVCVPRGRVAPVIEQLADCGLDWHRRTLVFWDTFVSSADMSPLTSRGAAAATVIPVPGADFRLLVIEGAPPAVRRFRQMFAHRGTRVLEIRTEWKALFGAGLTFAGALQVPLVHACYESLRHAGLQPLEAEALTESLLLRSIRAYWKAGRKGWSGPLARGEREQVCRQSAALVRFRPALARYYAACASGAVGLWGPANAEWLREILNTVTTTDI